MSVKNSILSIPVATFNSATLDPVIFQAININGLPESCFELIISNFSTAGLVYSFDGINDHNYMNQNQVLLLRGGNGGSQPNNNNALWAKGTRLFVRGAAGVGTIVLAGLYQPQGA